MKSPIPTLLALAFFLLSAQAHAQLPAFPGAEGYGSIAAGGRGGDVYYVRPLTRIWSIRLQTPVPGASRTSPSKERLAPWPPPHRSFPKISIHFPR